MEALRRRILDLIPGGETPLEPNMKRVRWTCVNALFRVFLLSTSLMFSRSAIGDAMTTFTRSDPVPFGTCSGPCMPSILQ